MIASIAGKHEFPARGHFGVEEKAAVIAVMDRAMAAGVAPGYNGDDERAYCEEFAAFLGGGFADAVSSGTAGIYVALKTLDLEPFSEVVVGAVTDPGGVMPVPLLNLIPVIADSAPGSYNTGPEQVGAVLSPYTAAIIVPHIGGEPADVKGIVGVARERGIPVIEDCSQAHGATLEGRPVGTFGDLAVFSTMGGKHHSTGGQGGLIYTADEALYRRVRQLSDRGKPFFLPEGSTNVEASLNFNLSDMAAAIGRAQLLKLPNWVARRQSVAERLAKGIRNLETVSVPAVLEGAQSSYWFLRLRFNMRSATCDKATYCSTLGAAGLPITADYRAALPWTQDWFVQRRVFGRRGYPWASPDYDGDRYGEPACPNAESAMASDFIVHIHEGWL